MSIKQYYSGNSIKDPGGLGHPGAGKYWNYNSSSASYYHTSGLKETRRYGPLRYAGLLLAPAEGFGLRPSLFCPSGKKRAFMLFLPNFGNFWCSVVTVVTFSSNLSNFERNKKKLKKSKKNPKKNLNNSKNPKIVKNG